MDFLKKERLVPVEEEPRQRINHDNEFVSIPSDAVVQDESQRCMNCGTPFCRSRCPLGNDIPRFNRHASAGAWAEAYKVLRRTNPFPEFTGRVCPAPCESACTLGLVRDPVAIETLEKIIAEKAWDLGLVCPEAPIRTLGTKVAVVGSGPAGLSAAYWLNHWGHHVEVFERADRPGGLLMNGIPSFKLSKVVVQRRVDVLVAEGVVFHCGVHVGEGLNSDNLLLDYDAVLLATGATHARIPGIFGPMERQYVLMADDFLKGYIHRDPARYAAPARKRDVIILGGGDTGADCMGTAIRQGAKSVTQLDIRGEPQDFSEYPRLKNQFSVLHWPDPVPKLRTSSSHAEGGVRVWNYESLRYDPKASTIHARNNASGVVEKFPCDLIIIAAGYLGAETGGLLSQLKVGLDERQRVIAPELQTSRARIYAAGDVRTGASLVVTALAEGRKAAEKIHGDLAADNFAISRGQ